mgnify:CR=1 FL=1
MSTLKPAAAAAAASAAAAAAAASAAALSGRWNVAHDCLVARPCVATDLIGCVSATAEKRRLFGGISAVESRRPESCARVWSSGQFGTQELVGQPK